MRLIDADALMNKLGIEKECSVCEQNSEPYCKWNPDVVDVCEAICTAPTVTADTDTVSRQKMINTVNNLRTRCDNDIDAYRDLMVAAIEALPPSPSRPQWISCSERLPEHSCQTLVTTKWDTEYSVEYGFYWGEDNKWGIITNNVIAWMPLPEPYQGK